MTQHNPRDIAVVGMACAFPGAPDLTSFWHLLTAGRCAITDPPAGRHLARQGGYLDDVAAFDPAPFGIGPKEAALMDPHQRLALELALTAADDAGWSVARLSAAHCAVFIGGMSTGWEELVRDQVDDAHFLTGTARGLIANRITHSFGLHGPSMLVDCGQSSSLASIVLACASLRQGDSDVAFAGGLNLILSEESTRAAEAFGALSPDHRCRPFDARSNGYVRGEGGALLLLRRLPDALAEGDRIYAVISGAGMSSDGAMTRLALPRSDGQVEAIRAALADAGVLASEVDFVELHGTGTKAGDPVEAEALGVVFGDRPRPLMVGSVKANLGHLEGAAGIAGLVKAILAVHHGRLPAQAGFGRARESLRLGERMLRVAAAEVDLDHPVTAGVSSFGMGGSNCHVVLRSAPEPDRSAEPPAAGESSPLLVSGSDGENLRAHAAALLAVSDRLPHLPSTLAHHRTLLTRRAAVWGSDAAEWALGLRALADGLPAQGVSIDRVRTGATVLVFPGQGAQRLRMGSALAGRYGVFAATFNEVCIALSDQLETDLRAVIDGDDLERLTRTRYAQAGLVAFEVAAHRLLVSLGCSPDLLIGHSIGEIAAAHVAGVLDVEGLARLVAARGTLMEALPPGGGMLAIARPAAELHRLVADLTDVSVAVVNSPGATVVAGPLTVLRSQEERLAAGARTRWLAVSHAFHSPLMAPAMAGFREVAAQIPHRPAGVPIVSNVDASLRTEFGADYWVEQALGTVQFAASVAAADRHSVARFVEAGPSTTLAGAIGECVGGAPAVVTTGPRDGDELDGFARGLVHLALTGLEVDLSPVVADTGFTPVPARPLRRRRFWPAAHPGAAKPRGVPAPNPDAIEPDTTEPGRTAEERLAVVRTAVAAVLGAGPDEVDVDLPFVAAGLDSRGAGELVAILGDLLGVRISTNDVFAHPTPRGLALHLAGSAPSSAVVVAPTAAPASDAAAPVAVVSMACRYPGAVTPEDLWRIARDGHDVVSAFPDDRGWDLTHLFDPDPDRPGTSYTSEGGFVAGVAEFDNMLFGISAREALSMDPQQRKFLEVSWEAIERAGLRPDSLAGSRTGVFVGAMAGDYGPRIGATGPGEGYRLTGTDSSILSGRVAYTFGLTGPALTVNTACSSSLVALHLAAESLRRGETDLALAGGVTLMSTPGMYVELTKQRAVSPRGRCRAFSDDADGTGWSEGCGVVLLERLDRAQALGHPVLAVLRGSAVNEDGASNGLTAPNGSAQERVILDALESSGLTAADIDVVEAHGTGTKLGDPIELGALAATYGAAHDAAHPLLLGSLKSNIGHTQAAAGVAGVMKMVTALREREVPASLHVSSPTTRVEWPAGIRLATETTPWTTNGHLRRGGVSSFGIGGTNAHLILEEAPAAVRSVPADSPRGEVPCLLSARDETSLARQATRLAEWARAGRLPEPARIAPSLAASRASLPVRAAVVADTTEELADRLEALAAGNTAPDVLRGTARRDRRIAFVFPGQGSQWADMAVDLYAESPTFRAHVDECQAVFSEHLDWSVRDALLGCLDVDAKAEAVAQPMLFTMMTGLALLWGEAGVRASAVVGHSQGEVAAAWVAGILSLPQAVSVVVARSQAWSMLPDHRGAMASVGLPRDTVAELIEGVGGEVGIAAVNSRRSVTVSGSVPAVEALAAALPEGTTYKRISTVVVAGHSPVLEPIRGRLLEALGSVRPAEPKVEVYSTVLGHRLAGRAMDAAYWCDNMIGTVEFLPAIEAMLADGIDTFIEVAAHPLLRFPLAEIAEGAGVETVVLPTLLRGRGGLAGMRAALAGAHVHGVDVDWDTVLPCSGHVDLPTYAFADHRFWLTPDSAAGLVGAVLLPSGGAIATAVVRDAEPVRLEDVAQLAVACAAVLGRDGLAQLQLDRIVRGQHGDQLVVEVDAVADPFTVSVHIYRAGQGIPVAHGVLAAAQAALPVGGDGWERCEPGEDRTLAGLLRAGAGGGDIVEMRGCRVLSEPERVVRLLVRQGDADVTVRGLDPDDRVVIEAAQIRTAEVGAAFDLSDHGAWDALWEVRWTEWSGDPSGDLGVLGPDPAGWIASLDARPIDPAGFAGLGTVLMDTDAVAPGGPEALLPFLQEWAGSPVAADARLVLVSRGGSLCDGIPAFPDAAARWALVRAAQLEFPGRFALLDVAEDADADTVGRAARSGLAEAAVVGRRILRPGLAALGSPTGNTPRLRPGTVLITGGTGSLGSLVAEDLVTRLGATDLLLLSRSGPDTPHAVELVRRIEGLGASARVTACDVADDAALSVAVAEVREQLVGVVHTAGRLDDGILERLDPERVTRTMAPKAQAAATLDRLTTGLDLDLFVLYSSVVGAVGNGGQAAYAAANGYLDGIAHARRARGERATSISWGVWELATGLRDEVAGRDLERFRRVGLMPLPAAVGRDLFVAALSGPAHIVATPIDASRVNADDPACPSRLACLASVRPGGSGMTSSADWAARVATLPPADARYEVLGAVRREVAAVVVGVDPSDIAPSQPFRDLGFDSLMGIELRNRLARQSGCALPASLIFDEPTPQAVVELILRLLATAQAPATVPASVTAGLDPAGTADDDPVVVTGMACRLPGGVTSPEELWSLVDAGTDAIGPFPEGRGWPRDLHDPDPAHRGHSIASGGGFLYDAASFDNAFFSISPREARGMDPQQRILLETAWETFENARIAPDSLRGTQVGVYIGNVGQTYTEGLIDEEDLSGFLVTSGAASVLSGRIAYTFGLQGPAISVDTACSSSLVALHMAASAVRGGECEIALAGGVTVMTAPDLFVEFTRQGGMSPDSRCKSFSDEADGTAWGEGVALLLLERLSTARRSRHPVLAVVRGSATNQDGASNGLTAPNGASQQRVIRAALRASGLAGADVDVVEAHGTGTVLGDPIEAQAILATYGQERAEPLRLGSLKSNLGHTQGAAGAAGVMKMVLALQHETLPATLHCTEPSTKVDWTTGSVRLLQSAEPWARGPRPRRAAVSAFGISGTNAHLILEEAAAEPSDSSGLYEGVMGTYLWPLSARSGPALAAAAARLGTVVAEPDVVARSLAHTRAALEQRAVLLGGDRDTLTRAAAALASGEPDPAVVTGTVREARTAFLFTGQGAQRPGMGLGLARQLPLFGEFLREACGACDPHLDRPLLDVLQDGDALARTEFAQPATFAVEVALFRTLTALGVRPETVVGHSIGEIAAAHAAGVFSLADAAVLVCARGRLMQALPEAGAMLAVRCSEEQVLAAIADGAEGVGLAAVNGPDAVVVAGPAEAIDRLATRLGPIAHRLAVSAAFHSSLIEPMLADFATVLGGLSFRPATMAAVSTVEPGSARAAWDDPGYWVRHALAPVRFADAVERLVAEGFTRLVELGPDAILSAAARECAPQALTFPLLSRKEPEATTFVRSLAALHCDGLGLDWDALVGPRSVGLCSLPTYPFQHQSFWRLPERLSCPAQPDIAFGMEWRPTRPTAADTERSWAILAHDELAEDVGRLADALRPRTASVQVVLVRDVTDPEMLCDAALGVAAEELVVLLVGGADDPRPNRLTRPALALLRKAADSGFPRLHLLTRAGVDAGGDEVDPAAAAVWGLARSASLELPGFAGIGDVAFDAHPARLADALLSDAEDQWAVRDTQVRVPRLTRRVQQPATMPAFESVLVTGATGGLGSAVARRLARDEVRRLILLSRSGPGAAGATELVRDLEQAGSEVVLLACDIADEDALRAALEHAEAVGPAIDAVVHAAGSVAFRPVADTADALVDDMFRAKVEGAVNLERYFAGRPLRAFVLFSSIAATWGSGGQSAYAAANAYLDGMASRRRFAGEPATSIAWGPWAGAGMIELDGVEEALTRRGLRPLSAPVALDALASALSRPGDNQVVADIDWPLFLRAFTADRPRPIVAELSGPEPAPVPAAAVPDFAATLVGLTGHSRTAACVDLLARITAEILGLDPDDAPPTSVPFKDLGFDSLMVVELRDRVHAATGIRLGAAVIYDHPHVTALAERLREEVDGARGRELIAHLDLLEDGLAMLDDGQEEAIRQALERMSRRLSAPGSSEPNKASAEELFTLIDSIRT